MSNKRAIPYGRQAITKADITAVTDALQSDYLTQGPRIEVFEHAFADYIGADYAVAVSNGTAALHLSAMAMNVSPGDKVITTPITFSASANCVRYCGGEIVFADIDPETYLIDLDAVTKMLESHPAGTFSGIIPVDFAGRAVNMETFSNLAKAHGLWMIEDACHAPGGHFLDSKASVRQCGSGKFADLAIFSFHPVKHIAAGEGGMITTDRKDLYQRLKALRTHGIIKDPTRYINDTALAIGVDHEESEWPGWYMELQELGYNYRITDIQAALGSSQLKRADEGLKRRREIANFYDQSFQGKPYIKGQSGVVEGHAYHLYVVEVENRLGLYKHLAKHEIFSQVHYIPVHLMPYYQSRGWKQGDFPNAEQYYSRCLSLPMYPTLSEDEQAFVIDTINKFYE